MRDARALTLFIHLLLRANHRSGYKIRFNGQDRVLVAGEVIIGLRETAHHLGERLSTLRHTLRRLGEKYRITTQEAAREGTVVRFLRWDTYQNVESEDGTQAGTNVAHPRHSRGTHQELMNETMIEPTHILNSAPENLDTPAFRSAWDSWVRHRRELGKKLTPTSSSRLLKRLAAWGEARAVSAIEHSIAQGWQGVFEERKNHGDPNVGRNLSRVIAPPGKYDDIGERIGEAVSSHTEA
jgi:hypothetical protein